MPSAKPYNFNCRQCEELLGSYVDRELTPEEMAEVKLHLDHCPPCKDFFVFEESMVHWIGQKLRETPCPQNLFKKLCEKLPKD